MALARVEDDARALGCRGEAAAAGLRVLAIEKHAAWYASEADQYAAPRRVLTPTGRAYCARREEVLRRNGTQEDMRALSREHLETIRAEVAAEQAAVDTALRNGGWVWT